MSLKSTNCEYLVNIIQDSQFDIKTFFNFWDLSGPLSPKVLRMLVYIIMDSDHLSKAVGVVSLIKMHIKKFAVPEFSDLYYSFMFDAIEHFDEDKVIYTLPKIVDLIEKKFEIKSTNLRKKTTTVTADRAQKKLRSIRKQRVGNNSPMVMESPSKKLFSYIKNNYIGNPGILDLQEFSSQEGTVVTAQDDDWDELDRILTALSFYNVVLVEVQECIKDKRMSADLGLNYMRAILNDISMPNDILYNTFSALCSCPISRASTIHLAEFIESLHNVLIQFGCVKEFPEKSVVDAITKLEFSIIKGYISKKDEQYAFVKLLEPLELRKEIACKLKLLNFIK